MTKSVDVEIVRGWLAGADGLAGFRLAAP